MAWLNTSLVNITGAFEASEYVKQYKNIGLFFSANWCDPCVRFEEILSVFHKSVNLKDNLLGIITISDDKDEAEFIEHTSKTAWPAVRHSDFRVKKQLKHRYHVTGLPKLVIVEASSGRVVNSDAKSNVEADPEGLGFPWADPEVSSLLTGPVLFRSETVQLEAILATKSIVGLYFSADWCPPCRQFSPTLSRLHSDLKENGFEVLYCSLDKIEEKFLCASQAMPWPSFPFKDPRVRSLAKTLQVEDIPQLVIWDVEKAQVINRNAIGRIRQDPEAKEFPWRQQLVTVLTMGNISEMSSQIAFLFIAASMGDLQSIIPEMATVAQKCPEFRFYAASDEDLVVAQLREILKVGDQCPYLLFLDFESRMWARCRTRNTEAHAIAPFVEAVTAQEVELTPFPTEV